MQCNHLCKWNSIFKFLFAIPILYKIFLKCSINKIKLAEMCSDKHLETSRATASVRVGGVASGDVEVRRWGRWRRGWGGREWTLYLPLETERVQRRHRVGRQRVGGVQRTTGRSPSSPSVQVNSVKLNKFLLINWLGINIT